MSASESLVSQGNATDLPLISTRRWPISYSSIQAAVVALDVFLIFTVSFATAAGYSLIFHVGQPDLLRHAMTAIVVSAVFVPVFRDRGLYVPSTLLNWNLQARNVIVLWILTFLALA